MTPEEMIIAYLTSQEISGIGERVYAEKPVSPAGAYVLVRRAGGSTRDFIKSYRIYTEVRAKRDEEAGITKLYTLTIHEAVLAAMEKIAETEPVFGCRKNSDYDATLTGSAEYCYQALWQITM